MDIKVELSLNIVRSKLLIPRCKRQGKQETKETIRVMCVFQCRLPNPCSNIMLAGRSLSLSQGGCPARAESRDVFVCVFVFLYLAEMGLCHPFRSEQKQTWSAFSPHLKRTQIEDPSRSKRSSSTIRDISELEFTSSHTTKSDDLISRKRVQNDSRVRVNGMMAVSYF